MSRQQVAEILGRESAQFKRTPDSADVVFAFDDRALHLVFDPGERLKQIAVFGPNQVVLQGLQLIGEPIEGVRRNAAREGIVFKPVDAGLWCERARVLLIDVEGRVDGVEVCRGD